MSAVVINIDTALTNVPTIEVGKQGENGATQVVFDVSEMIETYGSGTAYVVVQRRGDAEPYLLDNTSQSGDKVTWTVSNVDTDVYGTGRVQLFWLINEQVAKTVTYQFYVEEALHDPQDAPVVPGGWISDEIGNLDNLTTTEKSNLVGAINEVNEDVSDVKEDLSYTKNPTDNYSLSYTDVRPDNLVNKDDIIDGFYINASGVQTSSSAWTCTPFIDIDGITHLYAQNIGLGAYYDGNKTFISSITLGNSNDVVPPSSAKYIRVSILPTNVDTAIISTHNFYRNFAQDAPVSIWKSPKKGFEAGYIRFTVPVNNTVATYNTTAETNNERTPNYENVDCILSLPLKYKPVGKPCKLIMMCHGAGKGVSGTGNWTENEGYNALVSMFVSFGYAVFDCNGFKNDVLGWSFWGNQRGIEAWRKAYLYVTDNYNVEKTFSIYAFSMGGLTAMNLAFQGFPNINAIAMGSPVLNLREVWNATDGTQAVLKVLYGLGDEWDESKVVGNNPYKHIMTLDNIDYCPYRLPPIKIWYGSTETNNSGNPAIEKEIARSFVNAVVNSGGYAFYREVSGRGHEICYGGSTIVNQEILTYLERYERVEQTFYS